MTWGSGWGFPWGYLPGAFDFNALFQSKRWKQLDRAIQYNKLMGVIADILSQADGAVVTQAGRVGIGAAFGDELDDWGLLVGIARNGMADELYQRAIRATARKVLGEADPGTIYDVVYIFAPDSKITLVEAFPANWIIWIHFLTLVEQKQVAAVLEGVAGLGIGAQAIVVDPEGAFQWASTTGSVTVTRHWSSTTGSVPSSESAGFSSAVVI